MKKTTVVLIEDHKLIREALAQIIDMQSNLEVVGQCDEIGQALDMVKTLRPDIVLLDINLGNSLTIDIVPVLKNYSKVIALTMHTQPLYAKKMIQYGAMGYITKNSSREEIFTAINEAMQDKTYICHQVKNILTEQVFNQSENVNPFKTFSGREKEIVNLVKEGMSSKEIAAQLCISVKTVEVHRYNILKKMNLKNTAALISSLNHSYLYF